MACDCCVHVDYGSLRWNLADELEASISSMDFRRRFRCLAWTRASARVIAFALLCLLQLLTWIPPANGQNEAFIQTDTELRYLVDGISVHMHSSSFSEESSHFSFNDLEDESYQIFPSPVKFHPPSLDFGEHPLGIPKLEKIILESLSEDTNIQMLSISSNTVHFHCSFFQDKFVSARGNTSFNVVYLGRNEGAVESSLFIHTSVGSFKYNLKASGTPNPYGLRPLVGVRMPLNSSFSPTIELHNPHSETLQVTEMYSSGGDLHLELPSGLTEGPKTVWEIPPYETKKVMKATFVARTENNHTAYIRIKTNCSEKVDLIVPVEVEVSSHPGIYCPQEILDFGVLRLDQEAVTRPLYLLVSAHKPISVQNVLVTPVNDAVNISFEPKRVSPDTTNGVVIAEITFDPSKVSSEKQLSGKIVVKSKNNQFKVTVPYRARLLKGKLKYAPETLYFLADGGRSNSTNFTTAFNVTNEFLVPLIVRNLTMDPSLQPHFLLTSFLPLILAPNESRVLFNLTMKNRTADLQLSGHLVLLTNVSEFRLEVLCYNGRLVPFLGPEFTEDPAEGFDFGTMGIGEKRDMRFALKNDNPIEIRIRGWGSNMSRSYVELLGSQRTSALEYFQLSDLPLLPKTLIIKPHHFILFRVGILSAPEQEGLFKAHVFIITAYQELIVPFRLRTAKGSLSIPGGEKIFQLGDSFPGKLTEKTIRIHSSFRHELTLEQFTPIPADEKFTFITTNEGKESTVRLRPGEITQIGRLLYDPLSSCTPTCYTSVPFTSTVGQEWLSSLVYPPSLTELDVFLFNSMREKFAKDTAVSTLTNYTFQLDANEVKGFLFRAQTRLIWPELMSREDFDFPMTQLGNTTYADISITNPSSSPLVVQAFLLPTQESSYAGLKKIVHHLRHWFGSAGDFGKPPGPIPPTGTFGGGGGDGDDDEGPLGGEDPTVSIFKYSAESFSFIDLDSDSTSGSGSCDMDDRSGGPRPAKGGMGAPVQKIHNLPNLNDTITVVLAPGANLSLRLAFAPKMEIMHHSLLVVRNNLTVLDLMFLRGAGGQGHIRFGNRRSGSPMPLAFDIGTKHLKDCDKAATTSPSNPPNLTVKRSFVARNTGSLPIYISGFLIEGFECEGYGFRVMNCQPGFVLPPNGTHKVDIAFTPDFTLTKVQRTLYMITSLTGSHFGVLNFTLQATLPPQSLAPCWAALPRPGWETVLGYVAVVVMAFFLVCVLLAAFFEADRILKCTFVGVGPCSAAGGVDPEDSVPNRLVMKPFNLKELGRQAVEGLSDNNTTTAGNSLTHLRKRAGAASTSAGLTGSNGVLNGSAVKVEEKKETKEKRKKKTAVNFSAYVWQAIYELWGSSHPNRDASETGSKSKPSMERRRSNAEVGRMSPPPLLKEVVRRSSSNCSTDVNSNNNNHHSHHQKSKRPTSSSSNSSPVGSQQTPVSKHSVAVETDMSLETQTQTQSQGSGKSHQAAKPLVPEKGRKARRARARQLAEQLRRKDQTKQDDDSSSTTTENNSFVEDEFDRDSATNTKDGQKPKQNNLSKDKKSRSTPPAAEVKPTPNLSANENKPKQKVEPYKFDNSWSYEITPPLKKSSNDKGGKCKENEAPVEANSVNFAQTQPTKQKKSAKVKGVPVEKSTPLKDPSGRPMSNSSAESPSPISPWESPATSNGGSGQFDSGSSSASSSNSWEFGDFVRQTEKFTQDHLLPYKLKDADSSGKIPGILKFSPADFEGISGKRKDVASDYGSKQKAKVLPFPKYQQDMKARTNSSDRMKSAIGSQIPPRLQAKAGSLRNRQDYDNPIMMLTRPPTQHQPIMSHGVNVEHLYGLRRPESSQSPPPSLMSLFTPSPMQQQQHQIPMHHYHPQQQQATWKQSHQLPTSTSTSASVSGTTSSQQFADALFATKAQHAAAPPPQLPEIFRNGVTDVGSGPDARAVSPGLNNIRLAAGRGWDPVHQNETYSGTQAAGASAGAWALEDLFPRSEQPLQSNGDRWSSPSSIVDQLLLSHPSPEKRGSIGGGALRESLWDPAFVPPETPAPAAPGSLWGSMGLGFGLSSLWPASSSGSDGLASSGASFGLGHTFEDSKLASAEVVAAFKSQPNPVGTKPVGGNSARTTNVNTPASSTHTTETGSTDYDQGFNPLSSGPSIWKPTGSSNDQTN